MTLSPGLRSLFAKEWTERRSTLNWGLIFVILYVGYCVAYEIEYQTRAPIAAYYSGCSTALCLIAVLIAMPTAAGEYTRRTIGFSASLPVSLRQVAWVRLLGAWMCVVLPVVVGTLVITVLLASGVIEQAGLRGPTQDSLTSRASLSPVAAIGVLWTTTAITLAAVMELLALLSLIGTFCRSERQVGFWGAIVFFIWMILMSISQLVTQPLLASSVGIFCPDSLAMNWGYELVDGSSYGDLELGPSIWGPLCGSLIVTGLLGYGFARRYGGQRREALAASAMSRRWRLPKLLSPGQFLLPGRTGALVWANLRQSLPLCLAGLTLAILLTISQLDHTTPVINQLGDDAVPPLLSNLAAQLASYTWFVGFLWSALVGVGVFSAELEPGLQQFWRTRPIPPATWFWTKFLVGLAAVLIVLDGFPALIGWKSSLTTMGQTGFAYLACIPLIHAQVYAVAVAAVCWLRRPVAAAAIALLFFMLADAVTKSIPGQVGLDTLSVYDNLMLDEMKGPLDLMSHGYPLVYGIVIVVIIGATLMAHRAAATNVN